MSAPWLMRLAGQHPVVWGAVFGLGLTFTAWLERTDKIVRPWNLVLIGVFSSSLILLAVSARNKAVSCGTYSRAIEAYNRRSMIWAFGYIVALGFAITVRIVWRPEGPVLWLIAVLPSLPIGYFVWAQGRYFIEEDDEYLRLRQAQASMLGTGLLLIVATFWGFLENFGVAPHAEGWWAVPVWAIGMGLGHLVLGLRDRQDREP